MSDANVDIYERLSKIEATMASRDYVHEQMRPVHETQARTTHILERLTEKLEGLVEAHEKTLLEKADQDKKLREAEIAAFKDQTLGAWAVRFATGCGIITGLSGAAGVLYVVAKWVFQHVFHYPVP